MHLPQRKHVSTGHMVKCTLKSVCQKWKYTWNYMPDEVRYLGNANVANSSLTNGAVQMYKSSNVHKKTPQRATLPEWWCLLSGCWRKDHRTFSCYVSSDGSECVGHTYTLNVSQQQEKLDQSKANKNTQNCKAKIYPTALWAIQTAMKELLLLTGETWSRWTLELLMWRHTEKAAW